MTTFQIERATPLAATPDLIARSNAGGPVTGATNATTGGSFNLLKNGMSLNVEPVSFRPWFNVSSVVGERMNVFKLDQFTSRADGWLDGAALRLCRVVDGVFTEVAQSTVAVSAARSTQPVPGLPSTAYLPSSTTAITTAMESWYRPAATVYFAVAAIGADGQRSEWSNVASGTFSTNGAPAAPSQTTESSITLAGTVDGALAAPTGMTVTTSDAGRTFDLSWTASAGAQGYIVHRSMYASFDEASYVEATDTIAPQAGDLLILAKTMDEAVSKADFAHDRVWGTFDGRGYGPGDDGSWPEEDPDVPWAFMVEDGMPFLRITNNSASNFNIFRNVHGPDNQTFFNVLVPGVDYVNKIVARSSASSTINLVADGVDTGGTTPISLTAAWDTHSATFSRNTVLQAGQPIAKAIVSIPPGATIDLREFWTGDNRYPVPGQTPEWTNVAEPLSMLRGHNTIKTYPDSYSGLAYIRDLKRLPLFLRAAQNVGHTEVWVQVEPHLWPEELDLLAEYLATPYDPATDTPEGKPGAYIRHQQGQTAPWTTVFPRILFEMGNEMWNLISDFYKIPDGVAGGGRATVTGLLGNAWKTRLLQNPDFAAANIEWVVGGWNGQDGSWNEPLIDATDDQMPGFVTIADYNGGWDNGSFLPSAENDTDWLRVLNNSWLIGRKAKAESLVALAAARGWSAGTYEAGPGYQLNGLNGAVVSEAQSLSQDQVMRSAGGATVTFGAWLTNAAAGMTEQNVFVIDASGVSSWAALAKPDKGSAPAPHWFWCVEFWNMHIAGGRVREMAVGRVGIASEVALQSAPVVQGWTITRAGKTYVALLNLSIDGAKDALVTGLQPGATVTRHWMTGADYTVYNATVATKDDVALTSAALDAIGADGVLRRSIPAGMAEVYEVG